MTPELSPALRQGLLRLFELIPATCDPWWIIGSTAMVLAGIRGVVPDDIDVISTSRTITQIAQNAGIEIPVQKLHPTFQSHPYMRIPVDSGIDIELMADLKLRRESQWAPLDIKSRVALSIEGHTAFIPSLTEQQMILEMFGRPKDLVKIQLIDQFPEQNIRH